MKSEKYVSRIQFEAVRLHYEGAVIAVLIILIPYCTFTIFIPYCNTYIISDCNAVILIKVSNGTNLVHGNIISLVVHRPPWQSSSSHFDLLVEPRFNVILTTRLTSNVT